MKKLLTVAAFALFVSFGLSAQVKNYVGIVREKHLPSVDEFLDDLAASLKKRGYSSYADYIKAYREGGFGSGFVYVDKDGKNYVVTNRHVVSQAASASIEFENDDGSTTKFEDLTVLITDDDIDLAILSFAEGKNPFKTGLPLNTTKLTDGQDVVSAGFPGLGGEPVWQFGKGSVTNSSARIRDLIDPSISTVIQHSAQIGSGNSGGPLLIASKAAPDGYEVVGINTWKAVGRDATNFSLPAALALRLIEKSKNPDSDDVMKNNRVEKLKLVLSDSALDYTDLVKFVSYDLAAKEGEDCLDDILRHASTKVINRVASEFAYNPIEGLRYAVAYDIYGEFSGDKATDENLSKIVWQKEHGLYRISSTGEKKNKKKSSSGGSKKGKESSSGFPAVEFNGLQRPYFLSIEGGPLLYKKDVEEQLLDNAIEIGINLCPLRNGIFGVGVELEHGKAMGLQYNAIGVNPTLRFPLNFNVFCITPRAGAGLKLAVLEDPKLLGYFCELGIETSFNFGIPIIRPGLVVTYRAVLDSITTSETYIMNESVKGSGLVIKLILGFSFD